MKRIQDLLDRVRVLIGASGNRHRNRVSLEKARASLNQVLACKEFQPSSLERLEQRILRAISDFLSHIHISQGMQGYHWSHIYCAALRYQAATEPAKVFQDMTALFDRLIQSRREVTRDDYIASLRGFRWLGGMV